MLKKITQLYFYGNIHIALAALFFTAESYVFLNSPLNIPYLIFVFGSTLCMYNLHRIVGLRRINQQMKKDRFGVIDSEKVGIIFLGIIGAIIALAGFLISVDFPILELLIPVIISTFYVLPIFPHSKRLRDYSYVKIFSIAIIWAWIAVIVPSLLSTQSAIVWLLFIEKSLYIFGITLAFDIRDYEVDKAAKLDTLATHLGTKKVMAISMLSLLMGLLIGILLCYNYTHKVFPFIALLCFNYLLSLISIYRTKKNLPDLFFTGWLDGLILLRGLSISFFLFI